MPPRSGITRIIDQEDLFADSLAPHYLQAKAKKQRKEFFAAAALLLFDRFPLQPEYMVKPITLQSIQTATKMITRVRLSRCPPARASFCFNRAFFTRIRKTASHLAAPPVCVEDWQDYLTLTADRARRVRHLSYLFNPICS